MPKNPDANAPANRGNLWLCKLPFNRFSAPGDRSNAISDLREIVYTAQRSVLQFSRPFVTTSRYPFIAFISDFNSTVAKLVALSLMAYGITSNSL